MTRATLGIATAGGVAAAVIADDRAYAVQTELQALNGMISCVLQALAQSNCALDDLRLIAVCRGPSSFTGLRIGMAFAKSIAQARDLPIAGVSSYDVAGYDASDDAFPRAALVQGKRGFYYARLEDAREREPRYINGTSEALRDALAGFRLHRLEDVPAAEQALRVARIGAAFVHAGGPSDWQDQAIDYGQRSNAELNWEARGARHEGSPPRAPRN